MRVTTDNLDKAILFSVQGLVVDSIRIHLAEAKLTALSDKATAIVRVPVVIFRFVFISHRRAIDHHFGAFDGLLSFITRLHLQLFEALPAILIDRELHALTSQGGDLRTVGEKRRAFVKSDLIDA